MALEASDEMKRRAAQAAAAEVEAFVAGVTRPVIGLGTGSTAAHFVDEVGARVAAGAPWVGVPTSRATRARAAALGIPLLDDEGPWRIDVTVDGADEVSGALDLLKGGGGAHTREKIVSHASRRNVIIVDASKVSTHLGERRRVPIELLEFGHRSTLAALAAFGAVEVRSGRSDAGNLLADVAAGVIDDPRSLDARLRAIPGVVETGLFVGRADVVFVADADGVRRLARP